MISRSEARRLNRKGNVIPIFTRIPADLDTPVGAFIKLAQNRPHSFLLESIEGGEKLARYSFLGFDPFVTISGRSGEITLRQGRSKRVIDSHPVEFLKELFLIYKPVRIEELPRFTGGGVGYFSYDAIRWLEDIPDDNPDDIELPEFHLGMYRHIVVFDHLKQEIVIIANILHDHGEPGFDKKYSEAAATINRIVAKLGSSRRPPKEKPAGKCRIKAHYDQPEFERMVRKVKRHIREGDVFQVVLSQRWSVRTSISALSVYRRLRRINPSPYMFLIKFGDDAVIGSSPEMLVRVEKGQIETRPIAGTRPRGKDERHDEKLIADLISDEKELAEHTMLVDLGRNDVGRVSSAGSVQLKEQMSIEKYSHVIHIVSSVVGKLDRGISPIEGHFACFPAGTVSGAPKIRAMEIIDKLEKERRGVYAGSIAYLDFWGNLDSCIAIRTVVKKADQYYIQAGAGIVADSKPAREFKETCDKARALLVAVTGKD